MWLSIIIIINLFIAYHLPVYIVILYCLLPRLPKSTWFKGLGVWAYFRRNMSVARLPDNVGQVIYAICPHGMYGEAATIYFVLNSVYSHVTPIATSILFYIPIVREFASLAGAVPANRDDIADILDQGQSIMLLPEGMRGTLYETGQDLRVLKGETNGDSKPRKGFIRVALASKHKKTLKIVPVWMSGVDKMYSVWRIQWIQRLTLRFFYYPWPLLNWGCGFLPRTDREVKIYFGDPISLEGKDVDQVFDEYVMAMKSLSSMDSGGNQNNAQNHL